MALASTHAKRDAIVLNASRGFASAPSSPCVFLSQCNSASSASAWRRAVAAAATAAATDPADRSTSQQRQDTVDEILARICSMFPTAREYDVRQLLNKYHYREAVVVSALQVQKHPIRTPGPLVAATPNKGRRCHMTQTAWSEITTATADTTFSTMSNTPMNSPSPHRPHYSPKIKLKYLKSVFPKAEEMFLLDLLSGADNNVNQVTQQLLTSGYQKKDKPQPLTPRRSLASPSTSFRTEPVKIDVASPKRQFISVAEKLIIAMELKNVFPEEAEAVIDLALESADFDLEKATTILRNSSNSKTPSPPPQRSFTTGVMKHTITLSSLKSSPSILSTFKDISALYTPTQEDMDALHSNRPKPKPCADGSPPTSRRAASRGPDPSLLLDHYVVARGCQRESANGADRSLLSQRFQPTGRVDSLARGPDAQQRRGPSVKTIASLVSTLLLASKKHETVMRRL